jgi:hypothetical protein
MSNGPTEEQRLKMEVFENRLIDALDDIYPDPSRRDQGCAAHVLGHVLSIVLADWSAEGKKEMVDHFIERWKQEMLAPKDWKKRSNQNPIE